MSTIEQSMRTKLAEKHESEFRETQHYIPEQFEIVKTYNYHHPADSKITYQITEQSNRLWQLTTQQKESLKHDPTQKVTSSRLAAAIKLVEQNLSQS